MKKIILPIILGLFACVSFAQTSYYVTADGDDSNAGTSDAPFVTVGKAVEAVNTAFADSVTITEACVIHIGQGTFDTQGIAINNGNDTASVEFRGMGADKTILTADQSSDTVPQAQLFIDLSDTMNFNLSISIENLKVYNYGYTNTKGKSAIFRMTQNVSGVSISIDSCVIDEIQSGDGALLKAATGVGVDFSITNSYLTNVSAVWSGFDLVGPIDYGGGTFVLENNIFDGFTKDMTDCAQVKNSWGVFGSINSTNAAIPVDARIINNTFINGGVVNPEIQKVDLCAFLIRKKNGNTFDLVMANNIMVNDVADYTGGDALDYSFYSIRELHANALTSCVISNNILRQVSSTTLTLTNNSLDKSYNNTTPEIGFALDVSDALVYEFTATGIPYIKTEGSLVLNQAEAMYQTAFDIAGTPRAAVGSIGAYEKPGDVNEVSSAQAESAVVLYPNPAQDVLYVKGEVANVTLYTLAGRMVQVNNAENAQININQLPAGMYIAKSANAAGMIVNVQSIVKQ